MTIEGFAELTLEAADLAVLEEFYGHILGLSLLSREHDRVWLAVGSRARLGLWSSGRKEHGDRGGRHVHFALTVDPGGLEAIVQRLFDGGRGAKLVEHDGGDRSLYVEDAEGNVLELWDFLERREGRKDGVFALG